MRHSLRLIVCILFLSALVTGAGAQVREAARPFQHIVADWNRVFEQARNFTLDPTKGIEIASNHLDALAELKSEATEARDIANEQLKSAELRLEALGPPPAEDSEQSEPPELAEKRTTLSTDIADYRARVAEIELALVRAAELEATLSALRRDKMVARWIQRNPLPLTGGTILAAVPEFSSFLREIAHAPAEWWRSLPENVQAEIDFLLPIAIVIAAVLIGWGIRRFLLSRLGRDPAASEPSYRRRLVAAIAEGVARGIIPALAVGAILIRISTPEAYVSGLFADMLQALCIALILIILASTLPRAVLAPQLPAWQLASIATEQGRAICRRISLLAVIFGVDLFLSLSAQSRALSPELVSVYTLVANGLEAGALMLLVSGRLWRGIESTEPERFAPTAAAAERWSWFSFWGLVRLAIAVLSLAGLTAALIGYSRMSAYLIDNLLVSGVIIGGLFLLRGLLRELIGVFSRSQIVARGLKLAHSSRQLLKFWGRALLDLVIFVAGTILIAPHWGVPVKEVGRSASNVLHGFEVGSVTISIVDIGVALGVFLAALLITRMIQRGLSEKVLPQTQLDVGVQNSLSSGLGYLGLIIAAALAISVVGIDLSNIALIAGALSVGIGFGLQNIVNNFVSGLILLVERPVKVGDWVVVGANEGFVRRINVRATELQTFQRASVIIPNADFLSAAVTNWTHKDRHGRIEIPVGVAYGSDTAKVRDILLDCARQNEQVLEWPEPFVIFMDFGASSLDFELRCFTGDVLYRLRIASAIRFEIDRRFREEDIEIPFPQRVVHFAEGRDPGPAAGPDQSPMQPDDSSDPDNA